MGSENPDIFLLAFQNGRTYDVTIRAGDEAGVKLQQGIYIYIYIYIIMHLHMQS